jgi:hypothetical protein
VIATLSGGRAHMTVLVDAQPVFLVAAPGDSDVACTTAIEAAVGYVRGGPVAESPKAIPNPWQRDPEYRPATSYREFVEHLNEDLTQRQCGSHEAGQGRCAPAGTGPTGGSAGGSGEFAP